MERAHDTHREDQEGLWEVRSHVPYDASERPGSLVAKPAPNAHHLLFVGSLGDSKKLRSSWTFLSVDHCRVALLFADGYLVVSQNTNPVERALRWNLLHSTVDRLHGSTGMIQKKSHRLVCCVCRPVGPAGGSREVPAPARSPTEMSNLFDLVVIQNRPLFHKSPIERSSFPSRATEQQILFCFDDNKAKIWKGE